MSSRPNLARTEMRHPLSSGFHALTADAALTVLLDAQIAALAAVRPAIPQIEEVAQAAAAALRAGFRLAYAGAGSSGLMALSDCLELSGTFGIPQDRTPMLLAGGAASLLTMTGTAEDVPENAARDFAALKLRAGDIMVCLAASGSTPYTVRLAELARGAGLTVAAFANVAASPLLERATIPVLLDTGPEVVNGSTRMGAATAQKVALNMMSVRMGVLLGHVHDGYMVNLTADNAKLHDRAARIVADIAGTDSAAARAALLATDGAVKPAVLVACGGTFQQARTDLHDSGGVLGPALEKRKH